MSEKTKTGVLGGTFNPIHCSHIYLALEFMHELELEEMIIVPAHTPPHKKAENLAGDEDRYNMCRLAVNSIPRFSVSRFELERRGKSYTHKTLRHLREMHRDRELFLIVGADMFLTLQDWREPDEIFELATICGGAREPGEQAALEAHRRVLEALGARCALINLKAKPLSSTEIRGMVADGGDPSGLIHPNVWSYIIERGLYSCPQSMRPLK